MDVLTLQHEQVEQAAGVIARAFHEDALNVYLYPDGETRARFAPPMFEAFVRYDQLFGQVDYLPGFTAVATWIRPGVTETPERLAEAGFGNLPDEEPLAVLDTVFGFIGKAVSRAAPEPHWHLRLLGVEPDSQGRRPRSRRHATWHRPSRGNRSRRLPRDVQPSETLASIAETASNSSWRRSSPRPAFDSGRSATLPLNSFRGRVAREAAQDFGR